MLVIRRKDNEAFTLQTSDGPIQVGISDIEGNRVKLTIHAPDKVNIVRNELISSSAALSVRPIVR